MARIHARKKGKSGSNNPIVDSVPTWVNYKKGVIEQVIQKLHKNGMSTAEIGQTLRDEYGIPKTKHITGQRITKTLEEKGLTKEYPDDLMSLFKKATNLRKHLENNKKDKHNNHGLKLIESKIRRLLKYYKKTGKINQDFRYNPERVKILLG